jgi:DNA invertase Pin-like site-specific DNA recombinase
LKLRFNNSLTDSKAKAAGRYRGRPEDRRRNDGIAAMLRAGSPWQQIEGASGCSRSTIAKVKKRLADPVAAEGL